MESERENVYEIWCMSVRRGNEEEIHDLVILSISFQVSHCVNFSLSQFFNSLFCGRFERKKTRASCERISTKQQRNIFAIPRSEILLNSFLFYCFLSPGRKRGEGNDGKYFFWSYLISFVLVFLFTWNEISTGDKRRRHENVCLWLSGSGGGWLYVGVNYGNNFFKINFNIFALKHQKKCNQIFFQFQQPQPWSPDPQVCCFSQAPGHQKWGIFRCWKRSNNESKLFTVNFLAHNFRTFFKYFTEIQFITTKGFRIEFPLYRKNFSLISAPRREKRYREGRKISHDINYQRRERGRGKTIERRWIFWILDTPYSRECLRRRYWREPPVQPTRSVTRIGKNAWKFFFLCT